MSAVAEEMQQWTAEQQRYRQDAQGMGAVLGEKKECGDREKTQQCQPAPTVAGLGSVTVNAPPLESTRTT